MPVDLRLQDPHPARRSIDVDDDLCGGCGGQAQRRRSYLELSQRLIPSRTVGLKDPVCKWHLRVGSQGGVREASAGPVLGVFVQHTACSRHEALDVAVGLREAPASDRSQFHPPGVERFAHGDVGDDACREHPVAIALNQLDHLANGRRNLRRRDLETEVARGGRQNHTVDQRPNELRREVVRAKRTDEAIGKGGLERGLKALVIRERHHRHAAAFHQPHPFGRA